jgi:pseudaminic acid cytidylyltransferase
MTGGDANAVAIIPARGGSKRLPRKNVIDFLGRPIIAYTIEAAIESGCFSRVVVSTEEEEIAAAAERFGAIVDHRRPELATDAAGVVAVCIDFLEREARAGRRWQAMCCLYATAPLRVAADIRATMALLSPEQCDFAMAVTAFDHQPHQALQFAADGRLTPMWPQLVERRASDLPTLRVGNGSTYAVSVPKFMSRRSFYGPAMRGYEMPRDRSVDIDTADDLALALHFARSRPPVNRA